MKILGIGFLFGAHWFSYIVLLYHLRWIELEKCFCSTVKMLSKNTLFFFLYNCPNTIFFFVQKIVHSNVYLLRLYNVVFKKIGFILKKLVVQLIVHLYEESGV
jgi:hypothetical protein